MLFKFKDSEFCMLASAFTDTKELASTF